MPPVGPPLPSPRFRLMEPSPRLSFWLVSLVRSPLASSCHPIFATALERASIPSRIAVNPSLWPSTCLRSEWLLTSRADSRSSLVVDRVDGGGLEVIWL
nr:hypothetical protein CFP56_49874 [Quercus suber]